MIKVLMVEDNSADAQPALEQLLSGYGATEFELVRVSCLSDAIGELAARSFQAILLDLDVSDASGLESLAHVRHAAPELPIIVLSGSTDEAGAVSVLAHGAQDYLVKGRVTGDSLARAILYAIERQRRTQSHYQLAHYDGLTAIPNRTLLYDRLEQALSQARRKNRTVALLFLDLDQFKEINDSLGHMAGDQLLQKVARRLMDFTRASDTVARLGGDEFALLLPDIEGPGDAGRFAAKILQAITNPFTVENRELHVSASIGISFFPADALDTSGLLKSADVAMYCAKKNGKNNSQIYSNDMRSAASPGSELSDVLRDALSRKEFVLHFQPLVDLASGRLAGVESLLRWEHPTLGLLLPASFVPVAEQTGLMASIGEWVLRRTCEQVRAWRLAGLPPLEVAVNLSPTQLTQPGLLETVVSMIKDNGIEPGVLELGLTGSAVLGDPESATDLLGALKEAGVRIAIDDFGTGHSSLNRLMQFSFDTLKIGRSFVQRATLTPVDGAIARGLIRMAHGLGLTVVAGGVETLEQLAFFHLNGCDQAQGFHLGRPQPASEMECDLQRMSQARPHWSATALEAPRSSRFANRSADTGRPG